MDGIQLSRGGYLSPTALAEAFNAAFEGYFVPMRHTDESLAAMVRANDIRLADSLIARTASGDLLGIALLGVRGTRGWVGGMAIVPEQRGQGNGAVLLSALIARASALGLGTLQLEVLDQNASARRLYERLGFTEVRPLVVYTGPVAAFTGGAVPVSVVEVAVPEALARFEGMHAVAPPWQRERASLLHMAPNLSGLCIRDAHGIRAYLLWMPSGGGYGLLDFGSRPSDEVGNEGVADVLALLAHLSAHDRQATLRAINVPPGDALGDGLATLGCLVVATQREMLLPLR